MSFCPRVCVGCVVITLIGGSTTASDVPHLYSDTFDVDMYVDDVRHVERIAASNRFTGDWEIEFMATRTDLDDTTERWTINLEPRPEAEDFATYVYVDGVFRYAM